MSRDRWACMRRLARSGVHAATALLLAVAGTSTTARATRAQEPSAREASGVRASPWATLRAGIDSLLDDPAFASAHWGVLIVDPARGDTLYSRNAGKLFLPASNQKLVTGAVALARLGPAYRWTTVLAPRGRVARGVLRGDLLVIGNGDPSMSDAMRGDVRASFDSLARALRVAGVRRITGGLVHAGDALPGDPYGFGWAHDDFDEPYSAPVDELFLNEGFARLVVRGGVRTGARARFEVTPSLGAFPVRLAVRTAAGPVAALARPRVAFEEGAYVVRGTLRPGDSVSFALAIREPARAWLAAFRDALVRQGVRVGTRITRDTSRVVARDTLVAWRSPELARVLPVFEKPSQNQLGELLFRTLGAVFDSTGSEAAGRRVVSEQLARWGVDSTRAAVRDGSGLSRHDYIAPEAIIRLLDAMQRSADSTTFREALPVAGIDGTIANRMRGTAAAGRVQAKTGTLDKARSLSGYVTTAGGATLLFSMLCNNWTTNVRAVERVQDAIAVRLALLPIAPPGNADRR